MDISLLDDRVIVRPIEPQLLTHGGVMLTNTESSRPCEGQVVAVGPGRRSKTGNHQPISVRVNQHVMFDKDAGTRIKIDGLDYRVLRESELLGVFEGRKTTRRENIAERWRRTFARPFGDDGSRRFATLNSRNNNWGRLSHQKPTEIIS